MEVGSMDYNNYYVLISFLIFNNDLSASVKLEYFNFTFRMSLQTSHVSRQSRVDLEVSAKQNVVYTCFYRMFFQMILKNS